MSSNYLIIDENIFINTPNIISKMKNSFSYQKKFLQEFESIINSNNEEDIDLRNLAIIQIPNIIYDIGLSFAYLIFKNKSLINQLIFIHNTQENSDISEIFEELLRVFNFSLYDTSIDELKKILIQNNIIVDEQIINTGNKNNLNQEQVLYESIKNLETQWNILRSTGSENDFLFQLNNNLMSFKNDLMNLQKRKDVNRSTIEFFEELIMETEKLKNTNNYENNNNHINIIEINKNKNKENYKNTTNSSIQGKNNINIIPKNNNNFNNNIDLSKRTFFYENEKIVLNKNQIDYIEFKKDIQFPLSSKCGEELKRQFCGFLNFHGGRIYIGINEENKIKGIILNDKNRDVLRNDLINLTYDFYPKCRLDKVLVYFLPIKKNGTENFIKNLFIIKIRVFAGDQKVLYSMTNKGYRSCIREKGKCVDLNSDQIYEEIIRRDESKEKNFIENNEKDPEPEMYVIDNDYEEEDEFEEDWNKNVIRDDMRYKEKVNKKNKNKNNKKPIYEDLFTLKVNNIDTSIPISEVKKYLNNYGVFSLKILGSYGYINFKNIKDAENYFAHYNGIKLGSKILKFKFQAKEGDD